MSDHVKKLWCMNQILTEDGSIHCTERNEVCRHKDIEERNKEYLVSVDCIIGRAGYKAMIDDGR